MKLIYKASNSIEANLIINQLEQSGIPANIEGEHLQGIELIDGGGFVKVLVSEEYFEKAKEIVNEIQFTKSAPEEVATTVSSSINFISFLFGAVVGASIVASYYYFPIALQKYDRNGDGEVDEKATYINYKISKTEFDRNFDGKPDFKYWYNLNGSPKKSKSDENFDGVFETESTYKDGNVVTSISDTTNDGYGNYHVQYKHGVLNKVIFLDPMTKKATKVQHYEVLTLKKAELDLDGDGLFDISYKYDELEEIIK